MTLTAEKRDSLKALYDVWGLDTVRREIERNEINGLIPPDTIAFARAWVAEEEAKARRTLESLKIAGAVTISMIGGTILGLMIL